MIRKGNLYFRDNNIGYVILLHIFSTLFLLNILFIFFSEILTFLKLIIYVIYINFKM